MPAEPASVPAQAPSSEMSAECRVFARYLAETEASPYVQQAYAQLRASSDMPLGLRERRIERALLTVARQGALATRVADGYARFFLPRSVLRRRLVLMLAILENSPGSEQVLNSGDEGALVGVGARLMLTGIASVLCALVGVVIFAPVHLASGGNAAQPARLH